MKKVIFALAAVVALAACSKEQTVVMPEGNAIGFNTFVENSTRVAADPSYSNTNLFSNFRVYGFVEGATLFDGTVVTGTGVGENANWGYEGTQYWIAGANYIFHAVAPVSNNMVVASTAANGVSFTYTNVSGEEDMLYAYAEETGKVSENDAVAFTFDHILSKVKFTFTNGYDASNATIKVKNVVITNAHNTANVALKYDATNDVKSVAWTGHNGTISAGVQFGSAATQRVDEVKVDGVLIADHTCNTQYESDYERFVIPSANAYEYVITFTVELYINGTQIDVDKVTEGVQGYNHTARVKFAPAAGQAYNICTTITAANIDPNNEQEPIEFTVTGLNGWENGGDKNATVDNNAQNN